MREIRLFLEIYTFVMTVLCTFTVRVFAQSVECRRDLNLGSVVADINGGGISVSQDGITRGQKNEKVDANGNSGIIAVRSPVDERVNIQVSGTNLYGNGNDVKVKEVTHDGGENFVLNISAGMEQNINLAAAVEYLASQKIGTYSGFYNVSANFETTKVNVSEMCPITINFQAKDIQVTEVKSLNFGVISKPVKSGGVARVSSSGGYSVISGNLQFLSDVSNGEFSIEASPETTVYISFLNGTLYGQNGSVAINNFTSNKGNSFIVPATGKTSVKVGADLIIENNQPAGAYSGTYGVIVNY